MLNAVSAAAKFHDLVSGKSRGVGPAIARTGLWVASKPYEAAVRIRNRLFDAGWKRQNRAAVPVISVGNLTLGGTGKTPCVEYIARFFRKRGVRVAVLSRGYGGSGGPNDEALVLEDNLPDVPHLQGADRVALAQAACEELESELLILDDGFQHRRLARDMDVVLLDATNPFGHGRLVPSGLLREPASSLRRADAVVLTRCDHVADAELKQIAKRARKLAPDRPIVHTTHSPTACIQFGHPDQTLDVIQNRPVIAFCGIGNPDAFRQTIERLGARIVEARTFADHHSYTRTDVEELSALARRSSPESVLVTTQKDLVKLRIDRLGDRDLLAIKIELRVRAGSEAEEFHRCLGAVAPR